MNAGHYTSLLPEAFRHKSTRVRILAPQVILLDFHGTISERRWEDKIIFPYVRQTVIEYLKENWNNETVQNCLPGLRNESFEQRFRYKYDDAPIINDQTENESELEPLQIIEQMGEFLKWQMVTKRETRETQIIERLIWQDGFRKRKICTPIYEDVLPNIRKWKEKFNCGIYIISSIDVDTLSLLCGNCDKGNLAQYLNGYVSSKKMGDKLTSDLYKQFYDTSVPKEGRAKTPPSSPILSSVGSSNHSKSALKSSSRRHSDLNGARSILFLTDSGQEAKAASQVSNGTAFECLLVNRPGNRRVRTYYLSRFQYIERFDDIEMVQ